MLSDSNNNDNKHVTGAVSFRYTAVNGAVRGCFTWEPRRGIISSLPLDYYIKKNNNGPLSRDSEQFFFFL